MHYPPYLGDYLLSNFIHPVYRLSRTTQGSPERTPVSNKTPPSQRSGATTLRTTDATFRTSLPTSLCGSYSLRSSRLLSCKRRVLIVLQTTYRGPTDARRPEDAKPRSPHVGPTRPEATYRSPETTQRSPETTQRSPQTTQRGTDRPESTPIGPTRHAEDLQTPSLGRPKWVLLVLRRPRGVLRRPKGVLRRPKGVLIVQSRPQWVLLVMQTTCRA